MYFRKRQAEDDVLVLGSVDLTAKGVGRLPEDFGVGQIGGGYVIVRHAGFSPLFFEGQAPGHSGVEAAARRLDPPVSLTRGEIHRNIVPHSRRLDHPTKRPLAGPTLGRPQRRRARCPGQSTIPSPKFEKETNSFARA